MKKINEMLTKAEWDQAGAAVYSQMVWENIPTMGVDQLLKLARLVIAEVSSEELYRAFADAGLLPGLDYKDLLRAERLMYRVEEALGQRLLAQGTEVIPKLLPAQQLGSAVMAHKYKELWDVRRDELGLWRKKDWETLLLNGCIDKDDLRAIRIHEKWQTASEEEKEEYRRIMRTVKDPGDDFTADGVFDLAKSQQQHRDAVAALMQLCESLQ